MKKQPYRELRSINYRDDLFDILSFEHFVSVRPIADPDGLVSGWTIVVSSETVELRLISLLQLGGLHSNEYCAQRRLPAITVFYPFEFSLHSYTTCSDRRSVVEYCRRKFAKFLTGGV